MIKRVVQRQFVELLDNNWNRGPVTIDPGTVAVVFCFSLYRFTMITFLLLKCYYSTSTGIYRLDYSLVRESGH